MGKMQFKPKSPVTVARMKVLAKYGLNTVNDAGYTEALLSVGANEEALREICGALFEGDFSKTDFENIDLADFHEGLKNFLSQFLAPSKK